MTSSIQQLRDMIPLYLNGSLGKKQATEFLQQIRSHPELEQELAQFSAINDSFEQIDIPDEAQFDGLFTRVEANIVQQHVNERVHPEQQQSGLHRWQEKFRELFVNPFVSWGVALAQFVVLALVILYIQPEQKDIRYQSLSHSGQARSAASMNIVFKPSATLAEINALLQQHQLDIVSGPSSAHVFSIAAQNSTELDELIIQLRQSDIVRFAEKTRLE